MGWADAPLVAEKAGWENAPLEEAGVPQTGAALIPTEPGANLAPTPERKISWGEHAASLPLTAASVITGGPAFLAGLWGQLGGGKEFGQSVQKALTFPTYSEAQQRQLEGLGSASETLKLPPTLGGAGIPLIPTAGLAAQQATRGISKAVAPITENLAARAAVKQAVRVAESYQNAPQIDASKLALKHGFALNPNVSNPSIKKRNSEYSFGSTCPVMRLVASSAV